MRALIKNTRTKQIGGDAIGKVEADHCGSKQHTFCRHSSVFSDKKGSQRMMAFSVPKLITHLSHAMVRYTCNMGACCDNFSLVLT